MNKLLIIGGIIVAAVVALLVLSPGSGMPQETVDTGMIDANDTSTAPDTTNDMMAEEDLPEDAPMSGPTIVDIAVTTDGLSTLVAAVTAAGLVDTLAGEGPFTVLAPQNSAFDTLPEGSLETLLEPANLEQLQAVLVNHVISGVAPSTALADGMTVTTLAGEELLVEVSADGVVTIGGATVVAADVEASNGVVHIIDTVLVPTE